MKNAIKKQKDFLTNKVLFFIIFCFSIILLLGLKQKPNNNGNQLKMSNAQYEANSLLIYKEQYNKEMKSTRTIDSINKALIKDNFIISENAYIGYDYKIIGTLAEKTEISQSVIDNEYNIAKIKLKLFIKAKKLNATGLINFQIDNNIGSNFILCEMIQKK